MIQIIRLKNGEDIIGQVSTGLDDYEINQPMSVSVEHRGRESGLVMEHWLPVQLVSDNKTIIKKEDVLTTFIPNKEFSEYYEHTVERLERLLQVRKEVDAMSDEQISEVMEDLLDVDNRTYH